jgi:hypothetical protein
VTLGIGAVLALATMRVERVGAAPPSWRDELCAPEPLHPCTAGVLQGGWPLAYLVDRPGISVMGQLAPVEDLFLPIAFAADVVAFWIALFVVTHAATSRRRPGAA